MDKLTQAKVLAAVAEGVQTTGPQGFDTRSVFLIDRGSMPLWWRNGTPMEEQEEVCGKEHPSRLYALAAAGDALGLTPDPAISGGLTEEEWALIRQLVYHTACKARYDYNMNRDLKQDAALLESAETYEALLTRLTGGGT